MQVQVQCEGAYAMAYLLLGHGEAVHVEHGAMVAMSAGVTVAGSVGGNVGRAVKRRLFGGETLLQGRYTAVADGGWVAIAPKFPGDLSHVQLAPAGPGLVLEQGAYLACTDGVDVDARWAGLSNVVLREGATLLHVTAPAGPGQCVFASYGGVQRVDLADGETMIVDTGHLVGWHDTVDVKLRLLSDVATSAVTGEGAVALLTGPGQVWFQTRAEQQLRSWLFPQRSQNRGALR